ARPHARRRTAALSKRSYYGRAVASRCRPAAGRRDCVHLFDPGRRDGQRTPKSGGRGMNRLTLIGGVLASTLVAAGCGPLAAPGASTQAPAIAVPAASAQRGDIQQIMAYSGDVRAREQITVL